MKFLVKNPNCVVLGTWAKTIDKNGNKASYNRNIFVPAGEEPVSELKIDTGKTAKTIVLSWKIPLMYNL